MRRRLFMLCSVVSLLRCAAVCVPWVRGRVMFEQLVLDFPQHKGLLVGRSGSTWLVYGGLDFAPPPDAGAPAAALLPVWSEAWERADARGAAEWMICTDRSPWDPACPRVCLDRRHR